MRKDGISEKLPQICCAQFPYWNKFCCNQFRNYGNLDALRTRLQEISRLWDPFVLNEYDLSYSWSKKLCSCLRKGDSGERKPGSGWPRKTTISRRSVFNERGCETTWSLQESLKDRTSTENIMPNSAAPPSWIIRSVSKQENLLWAVWIGVSG